MKRYGWLLILCLVALFPACATIQPGAPAFVLPAENLLIDVQPVTACGPAAILAIGSYDLNGDMAPEVIALVVVTKGGTVAPLVIVYPKEGQPLEAYANIPGQGVKQITADELEKIGSDPCGFFLVGQTKKTA